MNGNCGLIQTHHKVRCASAKKGDIGRNEAGISQAKMLFAGSSIEKIKNCGNILLKEFSR